MATELIGKGIIDRNITAIEELKAPIRLMEEIPNHSTDLIDRTRGDIGKILRGEDPTRLLIIVGPCSIHDTKAALEYAERLNSLREKLADELLIVMRTYPEKPRTTVGWTGLVYDPHLDGSYAASTGLATSRQLLADINNLGLACAVELLDPITPQYLDDLVSWAAVGARTTESQIHRQLASGVSMPVGFKNSTEGDVKVAVDAMVAASTSHTFLGINLLGHAAVVETKGNPNTHLVLRGGNRGTNYDNGSINDAVSLLEERNLINESSRPVMIDCSHGNSAKDYRRQSLVAKSVLEQIQGGQRRIMGIMLESNLREGQQKWVNGKPLEYGVSITDACIGWEETEQLLKDCTRMVRPNRYLSMR